MGPRLPQLGQGHPNKIAFSVVEAQSSKPDLGALFVVFVLVYTDILRNITGKINGKIGQCQKREELSMTEKKPFIQEGKKKREELSMPHMAFIAAMDWTDKVGEKSFVAWLKLHTFVNRQADRVCDQHIPYTFESLYEDHFKVSKSTFYRIIAPLWEFGLIDIIEYELKSKARNPMNIIVYEYPLNEIERKYKPLEKIRDWKKDYQSPGKQGGQKGAVMKKVKKLQELSTNIPEGFKNETFEIPGDNEGFKNETFEKSVDILENEGFKNETFEGFKNETLKVSKMKPNHLKNNLIIKNNNLNHVFNNLFSLSPELELINDILVNYQFTEKEREKIIIHIHENDLLIQIEAVKKQCEFMKYKNDIIDRAKYFINGIESNIGRVFDKPREQIQETEYTRKVPFYNWLEDDGRMGKQLADDDLPY